MSSSLTSKDLNANNGRKTAMHPTPAELEFLQLAYNRFYDVFDEVMAEKFWSKDPWYRLSKIKEGFSLYSELLNYEPTQWVLEQLKSLRPPTESEIGRELFRFVRNVIMHFPFFDKWDDIYIDKNLVNWCSEGRTIDTFLKKHVNAKEVKYRFWEKATKKMTYLSINFPKTYSGQTKIYLKTILSEHEGVKFSFILMRKILNFQVMSETLGIQKTNL